MYYSLMKACEDFKLYIVALNDNAYNTLAALALENVVVVRLDEFEDNELLAVKPTRSWAEYCWTCTPSVILYFIRRFGLKDCIYLDADLYFYSNPKILIDEVPEDKSVLITSHRYTPKYDKSVKSGKYCVQFMLFRNNPEGLKVLQWWRDRCLEACEYNPKKGLNADQKYLDEWPEMFKCVYELEHLGGGIAPWNVQQYRLEADYKMVEKSSGKQFDMVFYHFHGLKFYKDGFVRLSGYKLSTNVLREVYKRYIEELDTYKNKLVRELKVDYDPHGALNKSSIQNGILGFIRLARDYLQGVRYTIKYGGDVG